MFTGLIETLGTVEELRRRSGQAALTVSANLPQHEFALGESIAVNGVCLTVTTGGHGRFTADVSSETLSCSTLGSLARGQRVNIERALRLSDRLGGHLVTGHVDGVARIVERNRHGDAWRFVFQADGALTRQLVAKGSVAVDGISLTVNEVTDDRFGVMVIPHTLQQTTLSSCQAGEQVNIETDLLGKYVARLLGLDAKPAGGVTLDLLAKSGFL